MARRLRFVHYGKWQVVCARLGAHLGTANERRSQTLPASVFSHLSLIHTSPAFYQTLIYLCHKEGQIREHTMSTHRFRNGERVKTRQPILDIPSGAVGTVVMVYDSGPAIYLVQFDDYPGPRLVWGSALAPTMPPTTD